MKTLRKEVYLALTKHPGHEDQSVHNPHPYQSQMDDVRRRMADARANTRLSRGERNSILNSLDREWERWRKKGEPKKPKKDPAVRTKVDDRHEIQYDRKTKTWHAFNIGQTEPFYSGSKKQVEDALVRSWRYGNQFRAKDK